MKPLSCLILARLKVHRDPTPSFVNILLFMLQARDSTRLARNSFTMFDGWLSRSLKTLSMTWSSVAVVSTPQKADQSFASKPAPMTLLPLHRDSAFSTSTAAIKLQQI